MQHTRILFLIAIVFIGLSSSATDRISTGTGNWNAAGTWSPSGIPLSGDNITVLTGHSITMNANPGNCNNITVNGTLGCSNARTLNAGGNLVINNGGTLNGGTGTLNVAGTFSVPVGASVTIGSITLVINGASAIDGPLTINNTAGTKSFAAVTVSSSGAWNSTVAEAITVNGNLTTSGNFNCNSGTYTVGGSVSVNAGTTNFEGSIGGTLNVGSGAVMNLNTGNCSVTGAAAISGTVNVTTTTGTKVFANITVNSGGVWNSSVAENVTVNGSIIVNGSFNCQSGTYTVSGSVSVNSGTTNFEGTIGGNLTIAAGAFLNSPTGILTVTGTTTISGTLNVTSATSTKSFSDITINTGGAWNCTVAESFAISGNISCSGSFTSNTGTYTLSGAGKTISGTLSINAVSVTGSYTNNGTFSAVTSLGGGGSLTQGINSTLMIGGTSGITTLNATANVPNLVVYNGSGAQTLKTITYYNLEVAKAAGSIGTFGGNTTINNDFTVSSGIARMGAFTFLVSGTTSVSGELQVNSVTGTKTFNNLSVNAGGTWNSTVAESYTINGDLSNSGTYTANTGTYILAGAGKTISGTLTIPTVSVTGTYTNNATFTSTTSLGGAGTFSQGTTGTLNMGTASASFSVTVFNASASGNTVDYNLAGVQNVRIPSDGSYHHLTIGGAGNKTLVAATDINGNLTITGTLVANNFNMTVGGDWTNSGTFTPGTNTVTLDGSGAQFITKTGGETFNHLLISGSGTKSLGSDVATNGDLTINSVLDVSASNFGVTVKGNWINNGTFASRTGTVTMSGSAAQTIGGASPADFYNLTQNNAAGVSLASAQNLYGSLTISSGTFTSAGFNFTLISDANGTARIAAIPAGANFSGNIIMQRYTGTGPTDWRFLASPVSGVTLSDWADDFATSGFAGSTDPPNSFVSIYTYDETQPGDLDLYGYQPATNVTNPIVTGKGYWVYLGPTPVTFEVTGPPNKFVQSPAVTYTNSGDINNDGWNLISNPYPSALDWESVSWTKTNLDNAVYIYNSYTGSYASYVAGVGVNGGSRYIPSSQAFWVKANANGPAISADENVKTASDNTYLKTPVTPNTSHYPMAFRDFPVPFNTNTVPNSIKLVVSRNGKEDETFIQFIQGASGNFDGHYDAWKLLNLDPSLPSLSTVINDTSDLSINSMQELTTDVAVKIRMTVPSTGVYSIRRDSLLMLPMSSCIILEDLATGNLIDLRSVVSYSFTISDTTFAPRFILHVYAPVKKQGINASCANDSTGLAIATGTGAGPWNYLWMNANGDTLRYSLNVPASDTLSGLPVGIYTVEVSGSACGVVADTIEIKTSSSLNVMVNHSDVTCFGLNDGEAYAIVSDGISPFSYSWSNGSTTSAVNSLSPGNYSVTVTDGAGCTQSQFLFISQPLPLSAGFISSTDTLDLSAGNNVVFTDTSSGALFYYWNFGDSTLPDTSHNPVHYYSYAGTYIVMQVASNGNCSDTAYAAVVVMDSVLYTFVSELSGGTSIFNVLYENGEVYLSFDLPEMNDVNLSLSNSLGERILVKEMRQVQNNKIMINSGELSPGIYFATAAMKSRVLVRKVVITISSK